MLIKIESGNPAKHLIRHVAEILRKGGVIAYPTDTVYGIGCDLFNKSALERIYEMKKLPKNKPLSIICEDLKDLSQYGQVSDTGYKIMKRLLPGPYTFILKASRKVPKMVLTHQRTIGIRVPDKAVCLALIAELRHPMISTSASVDKDEILSDPLEIDKKFGALLDLVVDGGIQISEKSSVIDFTGEIPQLVRQGKGDVSFLLARR